MEENKYFTPNIEDFHVGFEYEETNNFGSWYPQCFGDSNGKYNNELSECFWNLEHNKIRVPYLTKEQIEAEGWTFIKQWDNDNIEFFKIIKDIKYLLYYIEEYSSKNQVISIIQTHQEKVKPTLLIRNLLCKDINTFRKIIKLLNIK